LSVSLKVIDFLKTNWGQVPQCADKINLT